MRVALKSSARFINHGRPVLHNDPIYLQGLKEGVAVEISMQYNVTDTKRQYLPTQIISERVRAEHIYPVFAQLLLELLMPMQTEIAF